MAVSDHLLGRGATGAQAGEQDAAGRRGSGRRGSGRRGSRLLPTAGFLIGGGLVLWGVLALVGYLLTRTPIGKPVTGEDGQVSRWFFGERTPTLNELTHYGSSMADTMTAIGVTVVVVSALLLWRRFHQAMVVLVAILGELFVFLLVTATVHRSRPPVPHLDPAPPTSSFPSGHTGAAMALYVGMAVLLLRSGVRRALAVPLAVLLCLIPVIVGLSRLYRGMHYLTDVLAGAIGGGTWLLITLFVLGTQGWRRSRAPRTAP
jgi:undecaprenyl-diphosphatase